MTAPTPPVGFEWPVATALRACVCDGLAASIGGPPARCCVMPGRDVAIDDCCAGQAWVRIVRVYRTSVEEFPAATQTTTEGSLCDDAGFWAVELGAGVVRCAPVLDDHGTPPSCQEQEQAARVEADDRARVRRATVCCLQPIVADMLVSEWLPVGPAGGCVGGELTVVVLVSAECDCDDEEVSV